MRNIFENMPAEELGATLAHRITLLSARAGGGEIAGEALAERILLLLTIADAQTKSRKIVAKAICDEFGASGNSSSLKAILRSAERALGLR
jgi:ribosomal protein S5